MVERLVAEVERNRDIALPGGDGDVDILVHLHFLEVDVYGPNSLACTKVIFRETNSVVENTPSI